MRHLATFASFAAVALCAGAAIRAHLPWLISVYLVAQACFALCGWWALQRTVLTSRAYLFTFAGLFGLVLILALFVAIHWPLNFWIGILLMPTLAICAALVALDIYTSIRNPPSQLTLVLIQGTVLVFCGVMTLRSLSEPLSADLRYAAMALGIFWTLQGVHGWFYAGSRGTWEAGNWFVPQMLALTCFGWLTFALSGAQLESARQHVTDEQPAELAWEEQ